MPSTVPRPESPVHGGGADSGVNPRSTAPAGDWIDRLAAARPEEFASLFHEALTDDFGAVARLHQMLETASEWCRTHGARGSASELDTLTGRLTDLGEELHLVGESLDHEIRSRRAGAAARVSPAVAVNGLPVGRQAPAPDPISPAAVRSLPRSR